MLNFIFCTALQLAGPEGILPAESITAALRDLYSSMDQGNSVPPFVLLQVLHMAFPRFAEKSSQGGFQQQDANECWTELIRMLQHKLSPKENNGKPHTYKYEIQVLPHHDFFIFIVSFFYGQ